MSTARLSTAGVYSGLVAAFDAGDGERHQPDAAERGRHRDPVNRLRPGAEDHRHRHRERRVAGDHRRAERDRAAGQRVEQHERRHHGGDTIQNQQPEPRKLPDQRLSADHDVESDREAAEQHDAEQPHRHADGAADEAGREVADAPAACGADAEERGAGDHGAAESGARPARAAPGIGRRIVDMAESHRGGALTIPQGAGQGRE